ncbi:MAG: hypothetical protein JWM36_386 [Hyphomicrobiales bacterium]|nr:hypothetical protein [Hyphomicrobiales bacterium]
MWTGRRFVTILATITLCGKSAFAAGNAQPFEIWTEGLSATHDLADAEKIVGVKVGLGGPLQIIGKAAVRQPGDPREQDVGILSWTVGTTRALPGATRIKVDLEGTGTLDPLSLTYAQNFSGKLTWMLRENPKLTSRVQLSSDVTINTATGDALASLGPEWETTSRLSGKDAAVQSDLTARISYRMSAEAAPDLSARLELRFTPTLH